MDAIFESMPFLNIIWESVTIESVFKFAVAYFFVIWIAIIIWVIKDISNRTNNLFLQILSILSVIIFTPLGVFLYLLIRPGRTVFEKYYQEVEENLDILSHIIDQKTKYQEANDVSDCPKCWYEVQKDFVVCPNCKLTLKNECVECKKEIRDNWKICPFCNTKQPKKKKKKD